MGIGVLVFGLGPLMLDLQRLLIGSEGQINC